MTAPDDPRPPEGLVAGKYRLTRLLGRGGMGAVWEGVHETLGTRVAVKFIDSEHATSDEIRQRFVNEARAAARLRSKHVVQVYDQGVGDDGRPYIVMEFLVGEPLDRRLDRLGRLTPRDASRFTLHVCRALAKAHEAGIVHRDLKPENVFLVHDEEDQTDVAKVVDFGIAKFTDAGTTGSSSTRTGAVLGTPQFMSPEQARGLRTVDHRTDLWAVGVIVYRALTGTLPFRGEAVGDLLVNICTATPPAPSSLVGGLPGGFDAWMARALAREPADRFQTAAELSDALAELCGLESRLATGPASGDVASFRDKALAPTAVTASPFATTPAPTPARSRPPLALLAALFVIVTSVVVVAARAAFHSTPDASSEPHGAAPPPARPSLETPPNGPTPPEVTPVSAPTAAAPAPAPSQADPAHRAAITKPSHHASPAPPLAEPTPRPPPAKHTDVLGY